MQTLNAEGGIETLYTTDGTNFFDTRVAMKAANEAQQAEGEEEPQVRSKAERRTHGATADSMYSYTKA